VGCVTKNILTFNPGWSSDAQQLREFTDVRQLQRQLKDRGVNMISEADESTTGPASFMIADPDGNTILVDQHVYAMWRPMTVLLLGVVASLLLPDVSAAQTGATNARRVETYQSVAIDATGSLVITTSDQRTVKIPKWVTELISERK